MLWRCLVTALCLLLLSACVIPILPKHQSKLDDLDFLKVHSTKKVEVIQRLGAPTFDGGRWLVYDDYSEGWGVRIILASPNTVEEGDIGPSFHNYHIVFAFNKSGVLDDYEVMRDGKIQMANSPSAANGPSDRTDGMLKRGCAPNLIHTEHFPPGDWSVTLSPSGEFAALSAHRYLYDDQTGRYQHLDTQLLMNLKLATTLPISETGVVEFSHDGRTAAIFGEVRIPGSYLSGPDGVRLLDTRTGAIRVNFMGHGSHTPSSDAKSVVRSVAFSQDGRVVASGASDGTVIIWDAEIGRERAMLKASANGVVALAFSPDGKTLATTAISDDGTQEAVKVWDVGSGKQVFEIDDASLVQQDGLKISWRSWSARLAYSPGGTQLAINRGWIVEVLALPFAAGSTQVMEQARNTGSDVPLAKVLNVFWPSYDTPLHLPADPSRLAVAFSPDGRRLVANFAAPAIVWDLASSRELWRVEGNIEDVTLSADGRKLYAASRTDINLYDVGS